MGKEIMLNIYTDGVNERMPRHLMEMEIIEGWILRHPENQSEQAR